MIGRFHKLKVVPLMLDLIIQEDRFTTGGAKTVCPYDLSYTVEKLTLALETLATHPGDVRRRLSVVYWQIHTLEERDFPSEVRLDWLWVMKQMTKYGPLIDESEFVIRDAVENTMRRSRNSSATKIAHRLYSLYWAVSQNTAYQ